MTKRFRKNDGILLLVIGLVLLAGYVVSSFFRGETGAKAVVTVAGEVYGTYPLAQDDEIEIKIDGRAENVLQIKDGKADMIEADCPDKLCVHQKAIERTNETIVCLPHKVVVEIQDAKEADFDSMT